MVSTEAAAPTGSAQEDTRGPKHTPKRHHRSADVAPLTVRLSVRVGDGRSCCLHWAAPPAGPVPQSSPSLECRHHLRFEAAASRAGGRQPSPARQGAVPQGVSVLVLGLLQ